MGGATRSINKMEEIVEMDIIIMEIITVDIQITMAAIQTMEDIPTTMVVIPTTTGDSQHDQHIGQTIMADIQIIMEAIQVMEIAGILAMVMEDTQTMDTLETVSGLQE